MASKSTGSTSAYRSVANVTLSFALVSIPMRVIKGTESHNSRFEFHQYHGEDNGRIKMKRFCEVCDENIEYADLARGLEVNGGVVYITKEEEQEHLPLTTMKAIEVQQFVRSDEISSFMNVSNYYLEPDGPAAAKAYALMQAAMIKTGLIGIAKVALREGKESLAAVRVEDGVLAMTTLLWPAEVRHVHFDTLDGQQVTGPTLKMALDLVDSMTMPFDPADYTDTYSEAMQELIDAKASGAALPAPVTQPVAATSLEDALAASLGKAKASRSQATSKRKKAS